MKQWSLLMAVLLLIACSTTEHVIAQTAPPQLVAQPLPAAPTNRDDLTLEGWVILRYSVLADGRIDNIVVVEKQPSLVPHRRAVNALKQWTYLPATVDGTPVDWHNNETLVTYRSDKARLSPLFFRAYHATQAYIEEGKLDWARRNNQRTLARATRLEVVGPVLIQNAVINIRIGDLNAAYAALARVTDARVSLLDENQLIVALKHRNILEFQLGNIVGALETLERRRLLAPVPEDDPIASIAPRIEHGLRAGSTIGHRAKILDDVWRQTLNSQIFAIQEVDGEIDGLRAECDRRLEYLEYVPDSEWTLPESWGNCNVSVEGREDTKFTLYEFREDMQHLF